MTADPVAPTRPSGGGAAGAPARLRGMSWEDIPTLTALEQELFADDAWTEQSWWSELAGRPRREYVVAVDEAGTILGYAGVDHSGDVADIMTIAVAPAGRRRGIGSLLLDHLLHLARAAGEAHVLLEVRADNEPAIALYTRFGFTTISVRRRYYPGGVDAHIMRISLEDAS